MKLLVTAVLCFMSLCPLHADDLIKITFATDWKAQAEHGGFYQAIATGLYKKEGLDVSIMPGGPQTDLPRLIAAGALDIAMASNNFQPINLVAAGADVKAVMASFQKDPQVLMVHPHVGAKNIADLKGRPVFLSDSAIAAFWPWMKNRFGFTDSQIRKYTYSLVPWLQNKETVQEGYISSEPYTASQAGVTPDLFLLADAGYPGYASMVMVRSDYLRSNNSVVGKFVKASIEGWRSFVWGENTAGSSLILADNPEMTQALIDYSLMVMKKNAMLGNSDTIGCMTDDRWRTFAADMKAVEAIPNVDVSKAYSLEFLGHCTDAE